MKGSFEVTDLNFDGEINYTYYLIVYSQAISKNVTDVDERFFNEKIDENFNYFLSIPLKFALCPLGYIYVFLENM